MRAKSKKMYEEDARYREWTVEKHEVKKCYNRMCKVEMMDSGRAKSNEDVINLLLS